MMHPVMRWGENKPAQEPKAGILHQIFADMYKSAPGTINKHNNKQHSRINTHQNADRGTDNIGIRGFQKEMRISNR